MKRFYWKTCWNQCKKGKKGIEKLLKETAIWIQVMLFFKHRVTLALKDAFRITLLEELDSILH